MTTINLPKRFSGDSLLEACLNSAKDIGCKAKPKDDFWKEYRLGSLHEESRYHETNIMVGNFLPALHVRGIKKGEEQDWFYLWTGFPLGFASKRRIEQYLTAVSKNLGL